MLVDGYLILESAMNGKSKEVFEVYESKSTFDHYGFSRQLKHEMNFYQFTVESLSKACKISNYRLSALMSGNIEFEQHEIDIIRKILHF